MMKRFLSSTLLAGVVLGSSSLIAGQPWDSADQSNDKSMQTGSPTEWSQVLRDKEGWIEGGADFLLMTSSLTTTFSDQFFSTTPVPPDTFSTTDRETKSINPDYNAGFAVDLRYRAPTGNDIGIYYHYIHNNGDGHFNKSETNPFASVGFSQSLAANDSGNMHVHLHIADFLFGRTYVLSPRSTLHFSGGLSYNNFHHRIVFKNFLSDIRRNDVTGQVTQTSISNTNNEQKNHIWGLGPKLGLDFEYWFFPTSWSSDLNLFAFSQFSLLYGKEWSNGSNFLSNFFETPTTQSSSQNTVTWRNTPTHEFYPNINLDVGLRYRYHFANQVKFVCAFGYKLFAYWNMEELARSRTFAGGQDIGFLFSSQVDDLLTFTGPYIRFSLAY